MELWLQELSQELLSCSPYITFNINIGKNIHQFPKTHQKMNPKQHGFLSGRSCPSQQLEHHNKLLEELEKSNNVDVIYLDFAKAFDKVDHSVFLNKLKEIGIDGIVGVCLYTIFYQTAIMSS